MEPARRQPSRLRLNNLPVLTEIVKNMGNGGGLTINNLPPFCKV